MDSWHSYPSIFTFGHRAIADLLSGPVLIEEKVDGSQFSFGVTGDGEIKVKSKGAEFPVDAPPKMFEAATATVKELASLLTPGFTYRAEYLYKPKHNVLCYDRFPAKTLIIFDINDGLESYLSYSQKHSEAARLGLECVPLVYEGVVANVEQFRGFLERISILGGQKIEGVVVKPRDYNLFGQDKKCLMGKFVSEAFKEVHAKTWRSEHGSIAGKDILTVISDAYCTPARWNKAIQRLRERGLITDSPKDIGALIKEVSIDIEKECADEIKERLFKWAWPELRRSVTRGLADWYKQQLLESAFETAGGETCSAI